MAELKLVINDPKSGRSYPKNIDVDLTGRKIGEKVLGSEIGLNDYEFQITGGSDDAGFPMRRDIDSPNRKRALLGSGVGVRVKRKGIHIRKTVRGNTISQTIAQVNLKVVKVGKENLEKALGIEPKEEKVEEKKVESEEEIKKEEAKPYVEEEKTEEKKVGEKEVEV